MFPGEDADDDDDDDDDEMTAPGNRTKPAPPPPTSGLNAGWQDAPLCRPYAEKPDALDARSGTSAAAEARRALESLGHVALLGDSTLRYQYLTLAFMLARGETPPFQFYSVEWQSIRQRNWDAFLKKTSAILNDAQQEERPSGATRRCREFCDCSRSMKVRDAGTSGGDDQVENRYLRVLPASGAEAASAAAPLHVSFFNWAPFLATRWAPSMAEGWPREDGPTYPDASAPFARFRSGADFLEEVVAKLRPQPAWVVVNRGLWERMPWSNLTELFETGRRLRERRGMRFVWRTTTLTWPSGLAAKGVPKLSSAGYKERADKEIALAHAHGWATLAMHGVTNNLGVLGRNTTLDGMHFKEALSVCYNLKMLRALAGWSATPQAGSPWPRAALQQLQESLRLESRDPRACRVLPGAPTH